MSDSPLRTRLLGSTLTNAASCMTYMHRYEDAEAALKQARATGPVPRIEAVEAVLLAAMDREEELEACLVTLAEANDPDYDRIRDLVQDIMDGREPHFCPQPVNEEAITAFWQWFADNEAALLTLYNQRDEELPEAFTEQLAAHLEPCLPFRHAPVEFGTTEDEGVPELFFFTDVYNRSLAEGMSILCAACPADLASRWTFTVERR